MKELPDERDRHDALREFGHNLVVIAGAGTGKTSLLVGRLLSALTLQHLEPRQVLALTFTENAAAEMQERLHRLLSSFEPWLAGEAIHDSDRHVLAALGLGEEFRGRIRELRAGCEELRISTFHGFCLGLLREHARELDLPPDLRLEDEAVTSSRFDLAFADHLRSQTEVHDALRIHEPKLLREFAWQLLALPQDCWEREEDGLCPDLRGSRIALRKLLDAHPNARKPWLELVERLLGACDDLLAGRAIQGACPPRSKAPAAGERELGSKARSDEATASLQKHLDRLVPRLFADPVGIATAMEFVKPFLIRYRVDRLARGELSFDDLLLLTRHHLMRDPGFRRRVGGGLRAILVDEFQDTDPLQYDVIFLLAANPTESQIDSPLEIGLRPSVLYIVGDANQSIYRFRRADVAAFDRSVEHVLAQNGRMLHLVSNFRSHPPMLELVHEVCSRSLAEDKPFQFGYRKVIPTLEGGAEDAVEIHDWADDDGAGARRELEGQRIIAILESLRDRGHAYGEVAILLRAATDLNWLLRPLREAGIPYVLEGSKLFYRRHEVTLAAALISALANPSDPVAILAVLRSSLVGASDREIADHLEAGNRLELGQVSDAGVAKDEVPDADAPGDRRVAQGLSWLGELHRRVISLPVDEALAAILTHPCLAVTEGTGFEGAQRLANLERLLDRLLSMDHLDLQAASAWLLRNTDAGTQDEESPLFDRGMDALRILTVHRAKGLEFDVVIVPDLARQVQNREPWTQAQRLFSAEGEEMVALRLAQSRNVASGIARVEAPRHQLAEERRLFYVAATRARKRLILLCAEGRDKRAVWREDLRPVPVDLRGAVRIRCTGSISRTATGPTKKVDADAVLAAVRAHEQLVGAVAEAPEDILPSSALPSSPPSSQPSSVPPSSAPPGTLPFDTLPFNTPPQSPVDQGQGEVPEHSRALQVGRAMHRYLALVDLGRSTTDAALLEPQDDPEAERDLRELAERFHRSRLRKRLAGANRVLRELPVAYGEEGGQVVRGTIDALVVEGEELTVLDYKTDRVSDEASAARSHQPQLLAYGLGVQKALGLARPPALEVHFLRDDHTYPLEDR